MQSIGDENRTALGESWGYWSNFLAVMELQKEIERNRRLVMELICLCEQKSAISSMNLCEV